MCYIGFYLYEKEVGWWLGLVIVYEYIYMCLYIFVLFFRFLMCWVLGELVMRLCGFVLRSLWFWGGGRGIGIVLGIVIGDWRGLVGIRDGLGMWVVY